MQERNRRCRTVSAAPGVPSSSAAQAFSNVVKRRMIGKLARQSGACAYAVCPDDQPLRFGRFEISPAERVLRVDGQPATLGARAFDLLLALAQRRDRARHQAGAARPRLARRRGRGAQHRRADQQSAQAARPARDRHRAGAGLSIHGAAGRRRHARSRRCRPRPLRHAAWLCRPVFRIELTPLLGREDDLAALAALLQRYRLVTRGRRRRHGQDAAGSASAARPGAPTTRTACAGSNSPASAMRRHCRCASPRLSACAWASASRLPRLCAAVSPLTLLLALDNAEHLLADVARTAAALLDAAPGAAPRRHQPGAAAAGGRTRVPRRPAGRAAGSVAGRAGADLRARWRCSSSARAAPTPASF